jgi:hypothetical protein
MPARPGKRTTRSQDYPYDGYPYDGSHYEIVAVKRVEQKIGER